MWATVVPAASLLARAHAAFSVRGRSPVRVPELFDGGERGLLRRHQPHRVRLRPHRGRGEHGIEHAESQVSHEERQRISEVVLRRLLLRRLNSSANVVVGSTDRLGTAPSSSSHMRELLDHLDIVVVAAIESRPTWR